MAYLSETTPEFPVISWKQTIPSVSVKISGTFTGGGTGEFFRPSLASSAAWGFNTDLNGFERSSGASPASLDQNTPSDILAETIQDSLRNNFGEFVAVVTAERVWRTSGSYRYLGTEFRVLNTNPIDSLEVQVQSEFETFGFQSGTTMTFTNSAPFVGYNEFNNSGYWAPYQLTVLDTRQFEDTVFSAESISGDDVEVLTWGNEKQGRLLTCPYVYAANIFDYRAGLTQFDVPAERNSNDPNNILQRVREAAIAESNVDFRVFQDNGQYLVSRIVDQTRLRTLDEWTEDQSGNGQLFSVNIPFRIISSNGAI